MRVLVVGVSWPAETFLHRLFNGLAERGVEVWIATDRRVEPPLRRLRMPSKRWPARWRDGLLLPLVGRGALRDLRRARLLTRRGAWRDLALLREHFDVVYFPWNAGAIAHLEILRHGPPTIVSCRGSQVSVAPHDPARHDLARGLEASFAAASAVHAVSDAIVADALAFGLDPVKARVIRPAVDPSMFSPAAGGEDPPPLRLISVGSLIWRKGFEDALHAVALAREAGAEVRFDLVGEGPERQRVLYTMHDLGLQDHVVLHGRQDPAAVAALLRASHVFVLSSVAEGIANAVLEAMACGLAVVSTAVGGMEEAIDDGVEGLLVPSRDPHAMAEAIVRLAEEPSRRRSLGAAARQRIVSDFQLGDQVDAFLALCREVATGDRANRLS